MEYMEYTEQTVEGKASEMPLLDQTLREESAKASGFVLLLQAMGIRWNSHHQVIFQRLAITT
jgi:hypothetical protein